MPIFPIWFHDKKSPKPEGSAIYEIAANGVFLHKNTPFWEAVVPVSRISVLEESGSRFEFSLPPIPQELVVRMAQFFFWAAKEHDSEAAVLIARTESEYVLVVPPQKAAAVGIKYDMCEHPGTIVGSFHSHGKLSAYHSSTDHRDEMNFDGIHGTFGSFRKNSSEFTLSLQAVINGTRFGIDPLQIMLGLKATGETRPELGEIIRYNSRNIFSFLDSEKKVPEYRLAEPAEVNPKDYQPPKGWIDSIEFQKLTSHETWDEFWGNHAVKKDGGAR